MTNAGEQGNRQPADLQCDEDVLIESIKESELQCPVCGAAELIHGTRDLSYTYNGETTVIAAVTGEFCPACAESILGAAESDRVMREMRDFSKQVNAATGAGNDAQEA